MSLLRFLTSKSDNDRAYRKINEAAAKGEKLSPQDWNMIILYNMERISKHEAGCNSKWLLVALLMTVIIAFQVYEHGTKILGILGLAL